MSRLIVVSNRVAAAAGALSEARGGLAVALAAALRESGGLWFGWSGKQTNRFNGLIELERSDDVTTATIDLEEQDIDEYYNGYANRTLWPLFHDRVDLAQFERDYAGGYKRANIRFAETLHPLVHSGDLVWVQDYHLIPLGEELRRLGCKNRIGFFLHIPWPPRRLLAALPEARELVASMFAYDVIGFHTAEWLRAFSAYAVDEWGAERDGDVLRVGDREVRLISCPVGIDADEFGRLAAGERGQTIRKVMDESANGRAMIIGVDRLDYSKGLEERFLGYERFLSDYPELLKEVFLLQIAPQSRASVESYQRIRERLDELSGRINGEHADIDWVPLRYVNRNYPRDVLAGLYRSARIGLVTPLRDGMNLVAKEFVAAQEPDNPGVLILSKFAGAAAQLKTALMVNPYSAEEMSDAIRKALHMPRRERIKRWQEMMDNIRTEDVHWWRQRFTAALSGTEAKEPEPAS